MRKTNYNAKKSKGRVYIEAIEHKKCIEALNGLVLKYGLSTEINWDIICSDALLVDKYDNKMDFVLGNPPYVRIHNLNSTSDVAKKYSFAQVTCIVRD